jgi:hypothetical protein
MRELKHDRPGTSVLLRSASVASARTQRLVTERCDQSTTTAFASRSACSVTASYASPARRPTSHQTSNPSRAKASAKSFARA